MPSFTTLSRFRILDYFVEMNAKDRAGCAAFKFIGLHARKSGIAGINTPKHCPRIVSIAAVALTLLSSSGCGHPFEDNGTHLAYSLEKATQQLRASTAPELVVHYDTLDRPDIPYYVEITPSLQAGQASNVWGSYLVVSGKTSGGTSYHNRFVFVPERLYIKKDSGGSTDLVLRKDGDRIDMVELR
jgi:hypothetical protein